MLESDKAGEGHAYSILDAKLLEQVEDHLIEESRVEARLDDRSGQTNTQRFDARADEIN